MSRYGYDSDYRQGERDFERNGSLGYDFRRYWGHERENRDYRDGFDDERWREERRQEERQAEEAAERRAAQRRDEDRRWEEEMYRRHCEELEREPQDDECEPEPEPEKE